MLKSGLRSKYYALRSQLSEQHVLNASLGIANKLLQLPIWHHDYYHLFLTILEKKEVDTSFLLSLLKGKDKKIVLPKVIDNTVLKHYLLTDNTRFEISRWGIPEPVDGPEVPETRLNVVFVPLLAFDETGHRVGYGKGFYDAFLGMCPVDTIKVGLSLFSPETVITDITQNDTRLDYCVTPEAIYPFGKG